MFVVSLLHYQWTNKTKTKAKVPYSLTLHLSTQSSSILAATIVFFNVCTILFIILLIFCSVRVWMIKSQMHKKKNSTLFIWFLSSSHCLPVSSYSSNRREDSGPLTYKEHLPVSQVAVGDTNRPGSEAKLTVGPLRCQGDSECFSLWMHTGFIMEM